MKVLCPSRDVIGPFFSAETLKVKSKLHLTFQEHIFP